MATPTHTYSPTCRLRPISSSAPTDDIPPLINTQFFYSSPIPIDDPLSAASTIITTSSTTPAESKPPLRPFTEGDNLSLERAWKGFSDNDCKRLHKEVLKRKTKGESAKSVEGKFRGILKRLSAKHVKKHEEEGGITVSGMQGECCAELRVDASAELRKEFCGLTRRRVEGLDEDKVVEGVMGLMLGEGHKGLLGTSPMVIPGSSVVGSRPGTIAGSPAVGGSIGRSDGLTGKPFAKIELDREGGTRSNRSSGVGTPEERGLLRVGRARADSRGSNS
ncbi:hypothetical protein QBC38DRAFT_417986, partial [Podospora fimiseda]